jgi:hypothetical protein
MRIKLTAGDMAGTELTVQESRQSGYVTEAGFVHFDDCQIVYQDKKTNVSETTLDPAPEMQKIREGFRRLNVIAIELEDPDLQGCVGFAREGFYNLEKYMKANYKLT